MKKLTSAIISTLSISLLSTYANSATFDCNKASTWVEKTICKSPELSKLDKAMAKKHKNDLAKASDYEDSKAYKAKVIDDQRKWLKFQRNTCKDKACLIREYTELTNKKTYYGVAWSSPNKLTDSELPSKNEFGNFSETSQISLYNPKTKRWDDTGEAENSISIRKVANKPYLSIIEGVLIFTNAHICEIEASKATWSQNHWVINKSQQNKTFELRLYPASYKNKTQLLLRDIDNRYRELSCGMRGYFDGIVLERE